MDPLARHGPSHPLALSALALLVINDHLLKSTFPGWVTGKLSDLAWLIVAPVLLAAIFDRLGVDRLGVDRLGVDRLEVDRLGIGRLGVDRVGRSRAIALIVAGAAFVALQLWAPLGEAWTALAGGRHVADPEDLLALPALLLAPLCWRRTAARPRRWALPLAAFGCLATSYATCELIRRPGDGETAWDPNEPLVLTTGWDPARHDTAGVAAAIHLREAGGAQVELVLGSAGNRILVCPVGGLRADTDYVWVVDPIDPSFNHFAASEVVLGETRFRTGSASAIDPVASRAECQRRAEAFEDAYECPPRTGETGERTGGTGGTGKTGDTGGTETGDSGVATGTGDTGTSGTEDTGTGGTEDTGTFGGTGDTGGTSGVDTARTSAEDTGATGGTEGTGGTGATGATP